MALCLSSFPQSETVFFVAPKSDSLKNYRAHQHTIAAQHVNVGICNRWRLLALSLLFARIPCARSAKQKKCIKLQLQQQTLQQLGFASKKTLSTAALDTNVMIFGLVHRTARSSPHSEKKIKERRLLGFYSYAMLDNFPRHRFDHY